MIFAVDPGKNTGWARFEDGELKACGIIRNATPEAIRIAVISQTGILGFASQLVIEKPQIYPPRKWKGDPNDLIDVALLVGAAVSVVHDPVIVLPHEWKGSVPKEILNHRTLEKLNYREKEIAHVELAKMGKTLQHNVIDAIGLGIWYGEKIRKRWL